ncbi:MAG: SHOCT domain-containing protein [Mycobacterium sp.]
MSGARAAVRIAGIVSVLAVIGFVITLVLNVFVLDKYNAYGELPVPGSSKLWLPSGRVTVSFHTRVIGSPTGGGLPVPPLEMKIVPPEGVADPAVTENIGSTTTVNNDSRRRVWLVQVPAEGTYTIRSDGAVGGFIAPRLAFGYEGHYRFLVWVFVALFVAGQLGLACALWWRSRSRRLPAPTGASPGIDSLYTVSDEGIRVEQLKTLAALRDSGALNEAEFKAEKRRILDGR